MPILEADDVLQLAKARDCCRSEDGVVALILEVAGGLRGSPVEVVPCETVDLCVPASANIVIEAIIPPHVREEDGPLGASTGYHGHPRTRTSLDAWLAGKPVISGGKRVAVIWGELSAAATQRGRPRPVNDTWIAACCLAYGLPLATLNLKDFEDFTEHDGLSLIRA